METFFDEDPVGMDSDARSPTSNNNDLIVGGVKQDSTATSDLSPNSQQSLMSPIKPEQSVARTQADELDRAMEEQAGKLYMEGNYAEAEPILASLLAQRMETLGATHVDTLKTTDLLGSVSKDIRNIPH